MVKELDAGERAGAERSRHRDLLEACDMARPPSGRIIFGIDIGAHLDQSPHNTPYSVAHCKMHCRHPAYHIYIIAGCTPGLNIGSVLHEQRNYVLLGTQDCNMAMESRNTNRVLLRLRKPLKAVW